MASALLRGRSSTTSRTMPRYTSSLTDLSRNGEIPMMNFDGDSLLRAWLAARESDGEKIKAQRYTPTASNFRLRRREKAVLSNSNRCFRSVRWVAVATWNPFSNHARRLPTFFSAPGEQVFVFMLIRCRDWVRSVAILSAGNGRCGRQPAARSDRIEVGAQVLGQLIQNHLSFFGLILSLCRLPVKDGRAVCDQGGQLILQSQQISGCFAEARSLTRDAGLQTFPFLAQLGERGIVGQSHR